MSQLARQQQRIERALTRITEEVVQEIGTSIHGGLVAPPPTGTPVDTGWARVNWIGSKRTPFQGTVGTPEGINTSAQSAGVVALATWRIRDRELWIVNNVPYITRLNAGHSQQSPAGFVERAIQRAEANVRLDIPRIIRRHDPR